MTGSGTPQRLGSTPCNTTPQLSFGATATPNAFKELDVTDTGYQDGNTWVTVFGFPPSAASYILSQFSQCKFFFDPYSANASYHVSFLVPSVYYNEDLQNFPAISNILCL